MRPLSKIALPMPVPNVSTTSRPWPVMMPRPCTSASFSTRAGLPNCLASASCRSMPVQALVPRCGAVMILPARTTPGKPAEMRSKSGSCWTSVAIAGSTSRGRLGWGVGMRTRLTNILLRSSSTDALRPVPPISIARVFIGWSSWDELLYVVRSGDNDARGHANEQAGLDNARQRMKLRFELPGIGDGVDRAVGNVVAAVGRERHAAGHAQHRPVGLQPVDRRGPAEGRDLDRQRGLAAERRHDLAVVDDDDQPPRGGRDDLLAQEGAAQPFDEVERAALDLVGAVDREIDAGMRLEAGEENA